MKMTKRDKKLLAALGAFCLLAGLWHFAVLPLHRANVRLREQIRASEKKLAEAERKNSELPSLRESDRTWLEILEKEQKRLSPMLKNYEIDSLLTETVLSEGLMIRRLSVTMPDQPVSADSGADLTGLPAAGCVWVAKAAVEVEGDRETMEQLIDRISRLGPGIRVTGFSFGRTAQDTAGNSGSEGTESLSLQLEIWMSGEESLT